MDTGPYTEQEAGERTDSNGWHALQQELRSHTHTGDEDGTPIPREGIQPGAIDGTRIDPTSRVTVAQLKVKDRDLLAEIDALLARASALESSPMGRAESARSGDLVVKGNIRYTGRLSKLDTADVFAASVRSADFQMGHSSRRGTRFPEQPLGRALVDLTDTLQLNYDSDWPKLRISGKEGVFLEAGSVVIGTPDAPSELDVHGQALITGDVTVGMGTYAVLKTRAIHGKSPRDDEPDDLYLCGRTGKWVIIGSDDPQSGLRVHGPVEIHGDRLRIDGRVGIGVPEPSEHLSIGGRGACIELGADMPDKEPNAGKIAYQRWSDALEIVGGGSGQQRRLRIWAEQGTEFTGPIVPQAGDSSSAGIRFSGDDGFIRYDPPAQSLRIGAAQALELCQGGTPLLRLAGGGVFVRSLTVGGEGLSATNVMVNEKTITTDLSANGFARIHELDAGYVKAGELTVTGQFLAKSLIVQEMLEARSLRVQGPSSANQGLLVRGLLDAQDVRVAGNLQVEGGKLFQIDHPLDPRGQSLRHASLEGPELGVYYRGEARLEDGVARVELPSYFEALVRKEDRTVQLTPKLEGKGAVSSLAASAVEEGRFVVQATDRNNPTQAFYWEVKGVRADLARMEPEIPKRKV